MAGALPLPATLQTRTTERVSAKTLSIPWYIWSCLVAVACSVVGGAWDISWHESVGRDTFWTTPHLLIQLCGILSGISCGYLMASLPLLTWQRFLVWSVVGVVIYGFYGYRKSPLHPANR